MDIIDKLLYGPMIKLSTIDKLLHGSIDMHCHHGPDLLMEMRVDALQAARQAQEKGMRAIVLKSHFYPTASLAYVVSQIVPDITVFGSICLDFEVGGLNAYALEASAKLGAKVVWMPTHSSAYDKEKLGLTEPGISIFDKEGKLLPAVGDILDIVKDYQMVLATGHISTPEAFALVDEARSKGISKIVATHPLLEVVGATLSLEEQQRMAEKGAFMEYCIADTMPLIGLNPMRIVEAVRAVGAERCIMSTDLGLPFFPAPAEGMIVGIATMLRCGLTEEEMELLVKINPAKLLDLD
ncbi:DUF6282 family protein [Chloroflexota bacterium]